MQKSELFFILKSFIIWRIGLLVILFFAIKFLPNQVNLLGGGLQNYLGNPYLWSWANFDGEHYLSIAERSYGNLEQYFFPLYPLLIKLFGGSIYTALFISNLSFLIALIGLYKLIRLDFSKSITRLSIILVLLFPTSFYFGSVYTESLFLSLVVWFFYFLRMKKWIAVIVLGSLASATRLIGAVLLIPLGLFGYMYFLQINFGDPFAFIHNITIFGEQRSITPVILPQVFYRYVFKIIPNLNYSYYPVLFSTSLEFIVAVIFLILIIVSFRKLRLSYSLYLAAGYLIPTLSGSFSSLPRYVLVLFPAFILLSLWLNKRSTLLKIIIYTLLVVCLVISTALFLRGFWIS